MHMNEKFCEDCQRDDVFGFAGAAVRLVQVGEECANCGYVRPTDLQLYLSRARDALADALLLGAAAADVEGVLRDARYFAVHERWKRGDGEVPSKVLGQAGSAPSLVEFVMSKTAKKTASEDQQEESEL